MTADFNLKCEVSDYLSETDHDQACDLLARSFPLDYESALEKFNFELKVMPRTQFIVVKDGSRIVGLLCLVDRAFPYHEVTLSVKGLSYMAVLSKYRDFSVTNLIKQQLFLLLDTESDLSIGFARKVMDRYWHPYGFVGFTNFGEIHVPLVKPRGNEILLEVRQISKEDIDVVCGLHRKTYARVLGGFLRDEKLWSYYIEKAAINNQSFNTIWLNGEVVSYFYCSENHIYEVACGSLSPPQILSLIADYVTSSNATHKDLVFHTGFTHPLSAYLRNDMHRMISRFEWKGGHILRISSVERLLDKIRQVIQSRLVSGNVRDFEIRLDNFIFIFMQQKLRIVMTRKPKKVEQFSEALWVKLIFGVIDPGTIAEFRDSEMLPVIRVMFPQENPQVPLIDQF